MVESKGAKKLLGGLAAQLDFSVKYTKIKNTMASVLMSDALKLRKKGNDENDEALKKPAHENSIFNIVQDETNAIKNIGKDLLERIKY